MNPSERINKIMEYKGLDAPKLARCLGLPTKQRIYDIVTGKTKTLSADMISKIHLAYPEISESWLLTGEGDMLIQDSEKAEEPSVDSSPQCQVPLIPIAAQGGSLGEFASRLHEYDCEKVISPIKDVDMAICVSGDSMAPEYPSGCQILVKKINERAFIDWGRVYVLDTVNGAVIKKVLPSDSPDKVLCVSINPEYPPFEVHLEHINAFYRVMMMMSLK